MTSLFKIDPKPLGAFVEYTLKPLLDDSLNLLEELEKHNVDVNLVFSKAIKLYILSQLFDLIKTIIVVSIIGAVLWRALHSPSVIL